MIYWFTGQPGHGKTSLAARLKRHLEGKGKSVFHIDGDDLRSLSDNRDYSRKGREENILLAQKIAHYLSDKGYDVAVSLVAPYRDLRESFKARTGCKEIYVHSEDARGKERFAVEYEKPEIDFLLVDTTGLEVDESFQKIIDHFGI